jgi:tRNA(Leu) C34 or U34 (ribose-2'-O)-methylase TrmL
MITGSCPERMIYGKRAKPEGRTPAILLCNPKYSANVGAAVRAASCFGASQVWWTGNRVSLEVGERLPREERMKGYKDVEMRQFDRPFEHFPDAVPVAIELLPNTECLFDFVHPENAIYVFGPEDGSIDQTIRRFCHRFVAIPSKHCTNLAAAVYLVLYDRMKKIYDVTGEKPELTEDRGWANFLANEDVIRDKNTAFV